MQISYWERESYFRNKDIIIIGSGIVGLTAAIALKEKEPALRILIIERGLLPTGASTKNAGFACFGSVSELLDDLKNNSEEETFKLVEKRWRGLQNLRSLLGDKVINFEQKGGYELFSDDVFFGECASKIDYLNKNLVSLFGAPVYKVSDQKIKEFGFQNVSHIIETPFEGQIDTGKMVIALVRKAYEAGIVILNGVEIKSISDNESSVELKTSLDIDIKSKKVLVATNGFAKQLLSELQVNPARAQVLITSPIKNLKIKGTFHYDKGYYYFRNVGDRVLFGGGRNLDFKGEETTEMGLTEKIQSKLEELLRTTILPDQDYSVDHRWSGIMGVGDVKKPIIKNISKNVICSVRLGGMGVAIGSLVGAEGAELVLKQ